MVNATLIHVDGTKENIVINTLEDVLKYIGGSIVEPVFSKNFAMLVDEDGKLAGKQPNREATRMLATSGVDTRTIGGCIAGDVVVCDRDDFIRL